MNECPEKSHSTKFNIFFGIFLERIIANYYKNIYLATEYFDKGIKT